MVGPRPVLPARLLIAATVRVLPAGSRDRYREELRTEIAELGVAAQLPQTFSLLAGSVALRSALTARDVREVAGPSRPLFCRLGRHRFVGRQEDNPETRRGGYLECARCGKKKDVDSYGPMSPTVAPGMTSPAGGG